LRRAGGALMSIVPDIGKSFLFECAFNTMSSRCRDRYRDAYSMVSVEQSLRRLKTLGFSPGMIVDGGAFVGNWTRLVKSIFPGAWVLMVEGDSQRRAQLEAVVARYPDSVFYEATLLGPERREGVTFFEMVNSTGGSSVLNEQSKAPRRTVHRHQERLDALLTRIGRSVDLIKLDVQGYELEVLKGASQALADAEVVLLEVALIGVNLGAPLLHEVVEFMRHSGFLSYDICELHRRPLDGALAQIDIIFVRSTSQLRQSSVWDTEDVR